MGNVGWLSQIKHPMLGLASVAQLSSVPNFGLGNYMYGANPAGHC
jgi:hypothetical protein